VSKARLIRAAGLRWPVEESFEFGKGCFGLGECQARLYTAILRHIVLVMAALAICAVTAARLRDRTDAQAAPPAGPDDEPPADPGLFPLTVREVKRLLAAAISRPEPPGTARPRRPLARMETPPPGKIPLVPQTCTPRTHLCPGQLAIGCCRTSQRNQLHSCPGHQRSPRPSLPCRRDSAVGLRDGVMVLLR
jgi:hypothetical protein